MRTGRGVWRHLEGDACAKVMGASESSMFISCRCPVDWRSSAARLPPVPRTKHCQYVQPSWAMHPADVASNFREGPADTASPCATQARDLEGRCNLPQECAIDRQHECPGAPEECLGSSVSSCAPPPAPPWPPPCCGACCCRKVIAASSVASCTEQPHHTSKGHRHPSRTSPSVDLLTGSSCMPQRASRFLQCGLHML